MRGSLDREAFGAFVLSMTHSVPDILGVYLLAKTAGIFLDAAGIEVCPLPIVPLFETIDDLRRAATIMAEFYGLPGIVELVHGSGGEQEVAVGRQLAREEFEGGAVAGFAGGEVAGGHGEFVEVGLQREARGHHFLLSGFCSACCCTFWTAWRSSDMVAPGMR